MIARTLLIIATVALGAWGLTQLSAERAVQRVQGLSDTDPRDAARLAPAVLADLDTARRGGRRATADVLEGQFLALSGREAEAVRVLRDHLADVPEDAIAWRTLTFAAREVDPKLAREARQRARELDPLGAP